MRTALVIGAGIAGPVAAIALQRAGITPTVYEAREGTADDVGAFLTLQVNGIDALRTLGIGHVVTGIGFATPSMRFRSYTGKLLGEVSTGAALPDGTVAVTLRRSDLYRALRNEAQRQGVTIEHGRRAGRVPDAAGQRHRRAAHARRRPRRRRDRFPHPEHALPQRHREAARRGEHRRGAP